VTGGHNDISKLLHLGTMAKMKCSAQMATGITYGDVMARKMEWIKITSIVESKATEKLINEVNTIPKELSHL
jgi:hypothetical protein